MKDLIDSASGAPAGSGRLGEGLARGQRGKSPVGSRPEQLSVSGQADGVLQVSLSTPNLIWAPGEKAQEEAVGNPRF